MTDLPTIELPSTPSIRLAGKVYPSHIKVNVRPGLTFEFAVPTGHAYEGLDLKINYTIIDSQVEVNCYLNRVIESDLNQIFFMAYELVRSAVDLVAFYEGTGFTVVLDQISYPDKPVKPLHRNLPALHPLCTAYNLSANSLRSMMSEVAGDRAVLLALRDLTETLEDPLREGVNCARAIEALARILTPVEKNRDKRWINLQQTLNISQAYLMVITDRSKGPRHGNYFELSAVSDQEVQIRAWTVMNRFLEYRKRGGTDPLPLSEFPML